MDGICDCSCQEILRRLEEHLKIPVGETLWGMKTHCCFALGVVVWWGGEVTHQQCQGLLSETLYPLNNSPFPSPSSSEIMKIIE